MFGILVKQLLGDRHTHRHMPLAQAEDEQKLAHLDEKKNL